MSAADIVTQPATAPGQPHGEAGDHTTFQLVVGQEAPRSIQADSPALQALYDYPAADYPTRSQDVWVRAGMIMSATGSATGGDGLSGSLACAGDRQIFNTLRAKADVIVVGAGTARDEGYGPSKTPLAIVSASGNLPPKLQHDPKVLLICPQGSQAALSPQLPHKHQTICVTECSPQRICEALAARGYHNVLLEGGPHILATWFASGHVHELCLTLSPLLVGPVTPLVNSQDFSQDAELVHMLQHKNALFTRWALPNTPTTAAAAAK